MKFYGKKSEDITLDETITKNYITDISTNNKNKRTHGAVTVEATIALTGFLFMFMMIYSLITICRAQAILGVALNNTAKEMSQYTYLYSLTGIHKSLAAATETTVVDDINKVADNVNTSFNAMQKLNDDVTTQAQTGITSVEDLMGKWDGMATQLGGDINAVTQSFTPLQESIETLAEDPIGLLMGLGKVAASDTMNLVKSKVLTPPICRALIKKHLKAYDGDDTERFLKKLCIVPYDGATGEFYLKGLDFSNSSIYASSDYDIVLHMEYKVRLLPLLPIDLKINLCQTAVTRGWADGDGFHLSNEDKVIEREDTDINTDPPAPNSPPDSPNPPTSGPSVSVSPPVSGPSVTVDPIEQRLDKFFEDEHMAKYSRDEIRKLYQLFGEEGLWLIQTWYSSDFGYDYLTYLRDDPDAMYAMSSLGVIYSYNLVFSTYSDIIGASSSTVPTDMKGIVNAIGTYGPDFATMLNNSSGNDRAYIFYIVTTFGDDGLAYLKAHPTDGLTNLQNATDPKKVIDGTANAYIDVDAVKPKLKTQTNTAFFWSGRTDGVGGADRAAEIAKNKGGVTLEVMIDQQGINMPEWDQNDPEKMKAWDLASGAYAEQVSGVVYAVVGDTLREGNIWQTVELPRLKNNKNVTKIIIIDPKTEAETVIFER